MKKITHKLRVAAIIATHASVPIHKIHSAGETFCVSGDRRLRELAGDFLQSLRLNGNFSKTAYLNVYYYDPERPKMYHFCTKFREYCLHLVLATLGPAGNDLLVRVQQAQGELGTPVKPNDPRGRFCLYCGAVLKEKPCRKDRRFCSPKCRISWRHKTQMQMVSGIGDITLGKIPSRKGEGR
jgi:hypothetical protein